MTIKPGGRSKSQYLPPVAARGGHGGVCEGEADAHSLVGIRSQDGATLVRSLAGLRPGLVAAHGHPAHVRLLSLTLLCLPAPPPGSQCHEWTDLMVTLQGSSKILMKTQPPPSKYKDS